MSDRAGLLLFLGAWSFMAGCGRGGEVPPDGEAIDEAAALGLAPGAELHSISLGGRGADEHLVPPVVYAAPGDAVEFRSVDHRVHTVSFPRDSLALEVFTFLQSTDQLGSPPLVSRGSRFILRLQGAPPGRYVFESDGHGGIAHGVIEVGALPAAGER